MYIYIHISLYVYIYIYICVCVCVCVWAGLSIRIMWLIRRRAVKRPKTKGDKLTSSGRLTTYDSWHVSRLIHMSHGLSHASFICFIHMSHGISRASLVCCDRSKRKEGQRRIHSEPLAKEERGSCAQCCHVLPCVAMCCHVLPCGAVCVAVYRSVLQCVEVCCSVSKCVAVCRSVLQCIEVCCSMQCRRKEVRGPTLRDDKGSWATSCRVLLCVPACCSVL